jgi:hypothetical protein
MIRSLPAPTTNCIKEPGESVRVSVPLTSPFLNSIRFGPDSAGLAAFAFVFAIAFAAGVLVLAALVLGLAVLALLTVFVAAPPHAAANTLTAKNRYTFLNFISLLVLGFPVNLHPGWSNSSSKFGNRKAATAKNFGLTIGGIN